MNVGQLKTILADFPDDYVLIGQYKDSNGSWPMGYVEVAKVPGDNTMVVVQVKNLAQDSEDK